MTARATFIGLLLLHSISCTSHLSVGQDYQSRSKLPLAVEYFDAGLKEDPDDEKVKDAYILAEQTYQWQLRKQIDRLVEAKSYLQAMTVLMELQDRALRMQEIPLPGESPAALSSEYDSLQQKAVEQLAQDLDARGNRSYVLPSDLRTCKQLLALGLEDPLTERRCKQILNKLRLTADIQVDGTSYPPAFRLAGPLGQAITSTNPELLSIVNSADSNRNATIRLHLSPPVVDDTGWFVSTQDAFHTWVHKVDRWGSPVKKTITVYPTKEQISAAKKAGRKPPEPRKEKKQVWEEVEGAYTWHKNNRTVHINFRVTVIDLRKETEVAQFSGTVTKSSSSTYFTYRGDRRARKSVSGNDGRHNAPPLPTINTLVSKINNSLPSQLGERIVKRLD